MILITSISCWLSMPGTNACHESYCLVLARSWWSTLEGFFFFFWYPASLNTWTLFRDFPPLENSSPQARVLDIIFPTFYTTRVQVCDSISASRWTQKISFGKLVAQSSNYNVKATVERVASGEHPCPVPGIQVMVPSTCLSGQAAQPRCKEGLSVGCVPSRPSSSALLRKSGAP